MNARTTFFVSAVGLLLSAGIPGCLVEIPDLITGSPAGGGGGAGASGGGGSGGGGSGATGGSAGGSGGATSACPRGMAHAHDADLGISFCVDQTEVTQTQYIAFLTAVNADPAQTDQPPECAFNTALTYAPDGSCPDFTTASNEPVYCVDWCDAYAYCAWKGGRLCGALDGGSLAIDAPVTSDEWHFACSGGFDNKYPYGQRPQVGACNIPEQNTPADESDDNTKALVGSFPECEGGFAGVFDMQGNVSEWTDRCEPGDGSGTEQCMTRGGHTYGTALYWTCDNLKESEPRNNPDRREVGFRCCADASR